uniref:Receptor kinase-like protein Xa21 n=1 Tax=Leersia perrieri TaxID=77586 RepID=A0A0D9XTC3_9ORYZ
MKRSLLPLLCLLFSSPLLLAVSTDGAAAAVDVDELALLSFKSSLLSNWGSSLLASWNTSGQHCKWPGVVCGRRNPDRVIRLLLPSSNLSGIISPSIGNLSFLREIDLSGNHLSGKIPPELGHLGRLRSLNLSYNSLQGRIPGAIGACSSLIEMDLSYNQLRGTIPSQIGSSMRNLVDLYLYDNHLSGQIPSSLAELPSIRAISLGPNRLSGEIPVALGNLTSLVFLSLPYNELSGAIPSSLGQLQSLYFLALHYNNLSGLIPDTIWNMSSLEVFSVTFNMLSGMLPTNGFSTLPHLEEVYMGKNMFHGHIPASVANASNISILSFAYNSFSGVVPSEIGRLRNLRSLQLGDTLLQAKEPNDWRFMTALTNCTKLQLIDLGGNMLGGVLPDSVSNLSSSLSYLSIETNKISGNVPRDIGNLINLESLLFNNNSLTGSLPSSLTKLKNLHRLNLYNNKLSGSLPLTIGNLTQLTNLDLSHNAFSGTIPNTLGNLTKLFELNLSHNNFIGPIPTEIFSIFTLSEALDVSYNNLEGSVPKEIGKLKNIVDLHADSNNLSGEIPIALGECQLLQHLFLQNNFLNGEIPIALAQLKGLDTLDISSNNLSGQIPKSLGDMPLLHSLNLSFNNFHGEVPTNGVFANVSEIYIQGNANLCGGIPELRLPLCSLKSTKKKKHQILLLAVVICLISTLAIFSLLYMLLIRHKRTRRKAPATTSMQGHPIITYKQLLKATDGFSSTNLLGSGSFGSVYKGAFDSQDDESTTIVAVKVLKLEAPSALKSFTAECEALRNMRHRNLVKIVTICSSIDNGGNDFKAIVYELMPNGSLEDWLHPATTDQAELRNLNLHQRVTILLDVAYALDYLHCHGPEPVVHCDIKSSNVLLDAHMVAHVGDFGLARILVQGNSLLQQSTSSVGIRGTIGYAAPEYGVGNFASTHGDIYSYGILVLETVTGKRPTDSMLRPGLSLRQYVEPGLHGRVMDVVDIKLVLDFDDWVQTPNDSPCRRISGCLVSLLRLGIKRLIMAGVVPQLCFSLLSICLCCHALASSPPPPVRRNATTTAAADELTLLSFKSMLSTVGHPSSSLLASWNKSIHYCSWPGVLCSRRHPDRVAALRMDSFNLSGHISPFLANLSFLRELDLSNNQLTGELPPELGRLGRLEILKLSANALQGTLPVALGNCTNLTVLALSNNQLHGEIPGGIGANLGNLFMLDLRENGFSGGIPLSLAELQSLELLFLYSNRLSGEIPPALSNLSSLIHLDLDTNMLSGTIPSSLGMLSSLIWLNLANNNLSGTIPASIWNISALWGLNVQQNNLIGVIPPNAFSAFPEIQAVTMDNNQFHGSLPASLANVSYVTMLQLGFNFFSGAVPSELGMLRNLEKLLLAYTLLEAKQPRDWEFITALTNCSQLKILELAAGNFGGVLPDSLSNLSASLQTLSLQYNTISGSIPKDIGNLISLQSLTLDDNSFIGTLPPSLGQLHNLNRLSVAKNKISGSVPLAIGNLTELNSLELQVNTFSGEIPSTVANLTKLSTLNLAGNNFTGRIPIRLFNMIGLSKILDLSHNNLEGSIPQEIGNLINLVEFHAESNILSGEIPPSLGECQLLQNVYLQSNFLNGTIPSVLSQLKGLVNLDLSNNNLSGQIPRFLGNITMLNYLNLSFNNFVGGVPNFGVFANITAFAIQGNDKLCGGIETLHLPPCSSDLPEKRHKFLVIPIVIISLVAIQVVLLLLYKYTRRKKNKTKIPPTTSVQGHPLISFSQLARATEGFSRVNLLGSGTFGSVYKGKLDGQSDESAEYIAVKVLKLQTPGALKSFIAECGTLRNLRHRNLVKIITACSSIDTRGYDFKAIVFDFMPNGSLEDWLHPNTVDQIEMRYLGLLQRVSILLDVAYALDYLHCHGSAPVVHCDIKSSNVLLDADMVAHVGDFGLAKILAEETSSLQDSTSSMGFRGTIGYAAPEYGAGNTVSTQGDIYSYGILVLETVTGKRPTDNQFGQGMSLREHVEIALHDNTMDIVDRQLTLELENERETLDGSSYKKKIDCLISLLRIGISCSDELPLNRMRSIDIINELHAVRESLLREYRIEEESYANVTLE